MKLLVKNIKGLVGAYELAPALLCGKQMRALPIIENAWLAVEDGKVVDFGEMHDWPGISDWSNLEVVDAEGKFIIPGWVDSHTHTVFAASREGEFVDRINGLSYADIAAKGGGILNSARRLADSDEEQLYAHALQRVKHLISMGTTTLEIKSGYGLSLEAELKMLRVIQRLKANVPIQIKSTFLGAHALPMAFKEDKAGYVDHIINDMIPRVAEERLADYIDAFCEDGYFSVDDTERILAAGAKHGMKGKIHVNQFTTLGGVAACVRHNALSIDHLEELSEADLSALLEQQKSGQQTIPVALPSCSFFLRIPYTPARTIIDAGLSLAIATDFNPGTTPSGNMNFVVSLACIQMRMTPEESINAATVNAACALELQDRVGSLTIGHDANFILTKAIPTLAYLPYAFGDNLIEDVFVGGKVFRK
ncbi:MAG: imidazolonepropionase [Cryomorphaceae bacterium]|nr:imidazolonepropionase [Cryomorphaceae bacterium]